MSRVTDHTRTEKIDGDSILFLVVFQVIAGNRYDITFRTHKGKITIFPFISIFTKIILLRNLICLIITMHQYYEFMKSNNE